MKCESCGRDLKEEWNYCPDCKKIIKSVDMQIFKDLKIKPLKGFCSNCAYEMEKDWLYCPRCSTIRNFKKDYEEVVVTEKVEEDKKELYTTDFALHILFFIDFLYSFFCFIFSLSSNLFMSFFFLIRPFAVKRFLKSSYDKKNKFLFKFFCIVLYIIPVIYDYLIIKFAEKSDGVWSGLEHLDNALFMCLHLGFAIFAFILICLSKRERIDNKENSNE